MRFSVVITIVSMGLPMFAQGNGGSGGPGGSNGGPGQPVTGNVIALKIPNEVTPPGGVAQMKFLTTEPTPISTGRPHGYFDDAMFDYVLGIELFDPTGDLNGVALVSDNAISVNFECVGSLQGADYPVMTIALHVRPDALPGSQSQFDLDSSTAFTVNYLPAIIKPIPPATVTVGGSLSITNVVPGGGMLPAGTVVKVEGLGFERRTQVQLNSVQTQSIAVVSATEIDIVLQQATNMTGKKIQVVNPDGSQDTYFSYMRGINLRASNQPMLAHAVPIFSSMTHSQAAFAPMVPASADQFSGLAMQNQNLGMANVKVTLYSAGNQALSSSVIALPAGYRLIAESSELTGQVAPPGSYVLVSSDQPIQVFGFLANSATQIITPFPAFAAQQ